MSNLFLALLILLCAALPARAQETARTPPAPAAATAAPPPFIFPLACALGRECWTVNYMDDDSGTGRAQDFRCGAVTYEGHDGTDFGIRDLKSMADGVTVVAAAGGKVLRVRDESEDRMPSTEDIARLLAERKGCGNGVLIDHGGGWQSIYCHLKHGSLAVRQDQTVFAGAEIGQVGHSGSAEFPHLHFGVLKNGEMIDPYTGMPAHENVCVAKAVSMMDKKPLWWPDLHMKYVPFSLYASGFAPGEPDFEELRKDAASPELMSAAGLKALTFWTGIYGAVAGDQIHMEITGPGGTVFASRDIVQDKNRPRQFYFVGKKIDSAALTPGVYRGKLTLTRTDTDGKPLSSDTTQTLTLTP